jgi:hypothetical protein
MSNFESALTRIRESIDAYGACSFSTLHNEIVHQVIGCGNLSESHRLCKEAIARLVELRVLVEVHDGLGIVWGYPSDF